MAAELKPCPFCGNDELEILSEFNRFLRDTYHRVFCPCCGGSGSAHVHKEIAVKRWNRRTSVQVNVYDHEETFPNCTVQVLTNTATGETSVGWWKNGT